MYLVAERQENREFNGFSTLDKIKLILINIYMLAFLVFDLSYIKKQAYERGNFNLAELYFMLGYFFASEAYGLYMYLVERNISSSKTISQQISWVGTIGLHALSFVKIFLCGLSLSGSQHKFFSIYFLIRYTIYASTFFIILNQLRVIRFFVLKSNQLLGILHRCKSFVIADAGWQLANFNKVFYVSLLGISVDVVAFGNDFNFCVWICMTSICLLYELNKHMKKNQNWKQLKHIFQSG